MPHPSNRRNIALQSVERFSGRKRASWHAAPIAVHHPDVAHGRTSKQDACGSRGTGHGASGVRTAWRPSFVKAAVSAARLVAAGVRITRRSVDRPRCRLCKRLAVQPRIRPPVRHAAPSRHRSLHGAGRLRRSASAVCARLTRARQLSVTTRRIDCRAARTGMATGAPLAQPAARNRLRSR